MSGNILRLIKILKLEHNIWPIFNRGEDKQILIFYSCRATFPLSGDMQHIILI